MDELQSGIQIEKEHKATYEWIMSFIMKNEDFPTLDEVAKHIAQDHLKEHKDYYTLLKKAGL